MKKTALAVFFHLCRCRRNNPSRLHWQRCIAHDIIGSSHYAL